MIKVSKLADYAVVVLAVLSQSEKALVTACDLAGQTALPEPTVSKVLKLLAKNNVIQSVRGAGGGYKMTRRPLDISIVEIITAVDGPIALASCVENSTEECGYASSCAIKGRWNGVNQVLNNALQTVTLADMTSGHEMRVV